MLMAAEGLTTKFIGKTRQSVDVLRTDGLGRFLQLSALSLSEPLRFQWLRRRVAADARQALTSLKVAKRSRGLFIDCGSNIGQGYKFFSQYFTPDHYDYVLIEPNKNCFSYLRALCTGEINIEIIGKAASVRDGQVELFGPPADRAEPTHEGCSIVADHNGSLYQSERFAPDLVETFSLSQMIRAKRDLYDIVILKLDVEGAEYDILDDVLNSGTHRDIFAAYVEFHSLYVRGSEKRRKQAVEREIVHAFSNAGTRFRRWI
ncbi:MULTISPECIES: FkbM family methyltransferase [unclassified Mesorhizobium]|uniref:FkbM family methyltransferase n=1 Tax=unclassified Mesorhizobium TaxID=325217 RepID=UPI000FCABF73|nr:MULTISPECIES: FkbM family methyltransferase [unclassified Mesorhizobium]RUX98084.1 FkbM family methyltransferase [Mesorhizobium sp. M7D.F.Ca.US.004.01.2.1]RVA36689.1 FkbM family methyltransferase [Mesorhizobium sp. M7D.F.Ca.US.004.03.1.1]